MKIKQVIDFFENIAPVSFQESYDNAGLIVGNNQDEVKGILITLDVTEKVVQEAIDLNINLIVAHHPIVFTGLKRFNGNNYVERTVIMAIKNGDPGSIKADINPDDIKSIIHKAVNIRAPASA